MPNACLPMLCRGGRPELSLPCHGRVASHDWQQTPQLGKAEALDIEWSERALRWRHFPGENSDSKDEVHNVLAAGSQKYGTSNHWKQLKQPAISHPNSVFVRKATFLSNSSFFCRVTCPAHCFGAALVPRLEKGPRTSRIALGTKWVEFQGIPKHRDTWVLIGNSIHVSYGFLWDNGGFNRFQMLKFWSWNLRCVCNQIMPSFTKDKLYRCTFTCWMACAHVSL